MDTNKYVLNADCLVPAQFILPSLSGKQQAGSKSSELKRPAEGPTTGKEGF